MSFSILFDYGAGLLMDRIDRKHGIGSDRGNRIRLQIILLSVMVNLGILSYFKYVDFFIGSFVDLMNSLHAGSFAPEDRNGMLLRVILPLGISFFTFQSMSYTVDVYRRVIPTEKSLLRFALFVSFFPQLVAGPIVTARDFLPQLDRYPQFNPETMRIAARWFLLGFLKKSVIADNVSPVVDAIYQSVSLQGAHPGWEASWLASLGFWVQIYCDFSGYSDMAWGSALFLGFHLPENFRLPFISTSPSEFWRRWHISLMRWLRDYLYIPLGGNRVSYVRYKINLIIVMFLAGLWHGASWTFVLWGSIYGLILALDSLWGDLLKKIFPGKNARGKAIIQMPFLVSIPFKIVGFVLTTFLTLILDPLFRGQNLHDAFTIIAGMIGLHGSNMAEVSSTAVFRPVILGVLAVIVGQIIGYYIFEKKEGKIKIPLWLELSFYPFILLILTQIVAKNVEAFIYFVF